MNDAIPAAFEVRTRACVVKLASASEFTEFLSLPAYHFIWNSLSTHYIFKRLGDMSSNKAPPKPQTKKK